MKSATLTPGEAQRYFGDNLFPRHTAQIQSGDQAMQVVRMDTQDRGRFGEATSSLLECVENELYLELLDGPRITQLRP